MRNGRLDIPRKKLKNVQCCWCNFCIRAIIKTCSTSGEQRSLLREYQHYQIPNIAASPYIRQMYEAIGSFEDPGSNSKMTADNQPCLVLEWLDHCLWNIKSDKFRSDPALIPKLVAQSVLSALTTFKQLGKVHTGRSGLFKSCKWISPTCCRPTRYQSQQHPALKHRHVRRSNQNLWSWSQ